MYKNIVVLLLLALMVIFVNTLDYNKPTIVRTIPEQIIDTIVAVNNSSGVVVYSNVEKTLVLTSAHVVLEKRDENVSVSIIYIFPDPGAEPIIMIERYDAVDMVVDEINDLALVEIHPAINIAFSVAHILAETEIQPRIGDDLYIAANPSLNFRSIKKGTLSSKMRAMDSGGAGLWEVGGGIIFGASGGGIFDMKGNLFGIVRAVDHLNTSHCWKKSRKEKACLALPITYIGYIVPPYEIINFVNNSKYKDYFNYLQ